MNLNQITARIGELSAELLTLHNDLAFLTAGVVERPQLEVPTAKVFNWRDLKAGDHVHLQSAIISHGGVKLAPGIYKVDMVEGEDYVGTLPFCLYYDEENDRSCWIRYNNGSESLFRKVWM